MNTLEVLVKARSLISKPENWCVCYLGKTAEGVFTDGFTDGTVQRCALGALNGALGQSCYSDEATLRALFRAIPGGLKSDRTEFGFVPGDIAYYNNTHTHAEVLAWFDRAIAACGGNTPQVQAIINTALETASSSKESQCQSGRQLLTQS